MSKKAPAPTTEPEINAVDENEEDGSGYSIDTIADLTKEQIEGMSVYLDGTSEKPLGPNVACNGFFKKYRGAQIVGRVMSVTTKQNSFRADIEDTILFVQGIADYSADVVDKNGKVTIKKGRYPGTFGFQIDAGTMAIADAGRGSRVHLKVAGMVDLSGGRTRWTYDFVRAG